MITQRELPGISLRGRVQGKEQMLWSGSNVKGQKGQEIPKSRIKEESVTTDLTDIKGNIKQHYEQLYTNKLDNLDEMDKFQERHKFPKLTQKEIESEHV